MELEATTSKGNTVLRPRVDGEEARVTNEELFFDLVYAFAVTQLSHALLHHLTLAGFVQTVILWFAVWLGWQYTCWVTNWFSPEAPRIRLMLFAGMLAALVMAAAIPDAFGERGLIFAGAYVVIQVGRTAFVLSQLGRDHPLAANFRRMLAWVSISAVFWIAGALVAPEPRVVLWIIAVACEYVAPMFGFPVPTLGRSRTRDWTIDGGHLAERCQLFVIVALGETLLITGATLAETTSWSAPILIAVLAAFLGSLAMWWVYFGTSSRDGSHVIARADDPGRIGATFHYVHALLVAGIIATAVGNELVIAHPDGHATAPAMAVIAGGPALFLLGSGLYKRVVYGRVPPAHVAGLAALAVLAAVASLSDLLMLNGSTTVVMLAVGLIDGRRTRRVAGPAASA